MLTAVSMFDEGNVTLMVDDMERSVRFYTDQLGLPLKARFGNDWAELQGPGITIGLHPRRREVGDAGSGTSAIGLGVPDMEAAIAALADKGVRVGGVIDTDRRRIALFDDPDGNHLYLIHNKR
jgi:lactoylglutathione lyase